MHSVGPGVRERAVDPHHPRLQESPALLLHPGGASVSRPAHRRRVHPLHDLA